MKLLLRPILPWYILLILSVLLIGVTLFALINSKKVASDRKLSWWRRLTMVILLIIATFRPTFYGGLSKQAFNNLDVYLVIDKTISMMAEDYGGGSQTRLGGVIADVEGLTQYFAGARFGIITFDNSARAELPLTTDATAVMAAMNTLFVPHDRIADGSNPGMAAQELESILKQSLEFDSERSRVVLYFGDGENTSGERTSMSSIKKLINGGAVFGYGTEVGGKIINQRAIYEDKKYGRATSERNKYMRDYSKSEPAISKADFESLKKVASEMGVKMFQRNKESDIKDSLGGIRIGSVTPSDEEAAGRVEVYYLFVLLAMISLVSEWRDLFKHYQKIKRSVDMTEKES